MNRHLMASLLMVAALALAAGGKAGEAAGGAEGSAEPALTQGGVWEYPGPPAGGNDHSWMPSIMLWSIPMHPGGSQPGFGNPMNPGASQPGFGNPMNPGASQPGFGNPMNPGASQPGQWVIPPQADNAGVRAEEVVPGGAVPADWKARDLDRIKQQDPARYNNLMKLKEYARQYNQSASELKRNDLRKKMRLLIDHELKLQQAENERRIQAAERDLEAARTLHRWRGDHWRSVVDQSLQEAAPPRK